MVKTISTSYLLITIFICFSYTAKGQGCSDAGFCTMGAMKPSQSYNKKASFKLRSLEVNQYRGRTLLTPIIHVSTLDFSFGIGDKTGVQAKIPYQWVTGNLGNTSGVGDISLSVTRNILHHDQYDLNFSLGTKIPSNDSNIKKNGSVAYPMYYQTSLGSYDFIFGASLISRKWLVAVGYQQALTANGNTFRYEEWDEIYHDPAYLREHPLANNLKRGTDVMLRVERSFRFANYDFSIGALPIFRISKDEIFSEKDNRRIKMDGTTGMALTAVGGFGYHLNTKSSLKLIVGWKITEREINPDGLTRHSVGSLSYLFRF